VTYIVAETVSAEPADPAHFQSQAREADGNIGIGAGQTFGEPGDIFQLRDIVCYQQRHGFAHGDDVKWGGLGLSHFLI